MKFEPNENGKYELIDNETNKIVEFSFPIDAKQALMMKNKDGSDRYSSIPKTKRNVEIEKEEEKDDVVDKKSKKKKEKEEIETDDKE